MEAHKWAASSRSIDPRTSPINLSKFKINSFTTCCVCGEENYSWNACTRPWSMNDLDRALSTLRAQHSQVWTPPWSHPIRPAMHFDCSRSHVALIVNRPPGQFGWLLYSMFFWSCTYVCTILMQPQKSTSAVVYTYIHGLTFTHQILSTQR